MRLQPTNVLIGDRPLGYFIGLQLGNQKLGPWADQYRPLRHRAFDLEVGPTRSEQRGPNAVLCHNWKPVKAAANVVHVTLGRDYVGGNQHNFLGSWASDLAYLNVFVEPYSGIFAGEPIQLNLRLAAHLFVGRHRLTDGFGLAGHFHDIAHFDVQPRQVFRSHAGVGPAHILAERFHEIQLERLGFHFHDSSRDLSGRYLGHLISRTPLLHVTCIFALGTEHGRSTSLRYFLSLRSATMVRTSSLTST